MTRWSAPVLQNVIRNMLGRVVVSEVLAGAVAGALSAVPQTTFAAPASHDGQGRIDSVSATIDTGAFAPGNRDFSHFTVPEMCVAAANLEGEVRRRSLAEQQRLRLLQPTPTLDTLPASAREIARRCGAHFTVEGTTPDHLAALLSLAVLRVDDSLAHAVIRRQLSLATDAPTRLQVLADATNEYLKAEPARVAEAERLTAMADSLARREVPAMYPFGTHRPLRMFAQNSFDRTRMRYEADLIITALRHGGASASEQPSQSASMGMGGLMQLMMDPKSLRVLQLRQAYALLLELAFVDHPDSLAILARQAYDDLRTIGQDARSPRSPDDVLANWLPPELQYGSGPSSVAPVQASWWFPAAPPAWPPPGQVTLMLYGLGCMRQADNDCPMISTYFPDWFARYGTTRFGIVVVEPTHGNAVLSRPLTPSQEADSVAWYYRTYQKLPVTVGVVASDVRILVPRPDGRQQHVDTTAFGKIHGERFRNIGSIAVLFDARGEVLYLGAPRYPLLNALIQRAMTTARQ